VVEKFIGDAVNTAARVQATAEPGQVLTDEATYRLAASAKARAAGAHAASRAQPGPRPPGRGDGDQPAAAAFAAAVASLRENSTPYHLAHGLLDHAEYLIRHADPTAAWLAVEEARDIGRRLRCQPLLDRADALERAQPRIRA
jgi:hypothetical protein